MSRPQFWEEFFLLKVRPPTHTIPPTVVHNEQVNVEYLSNRLDGLEAQQLLGLKVCPHTTVRPAHSLYPPLQKVLNQLFIQACRTLQADDNMIRNINALQVIMTPHH